MTPFYQPYPWVYRNAELMLVEVSLDETEAGRLLPEGHRLRTPIAAAAWTLRARNIAGVGGYDEFVLNVAATEGDESRMVTIAIYVDNDAAMASGREVLGVPKRIADIQQELAGEQRIARVKRSGIEFATLGMTLEREGDAADCATYARRFSRPAISRIGGRLMSSSIDTTVHRVVHGSGFIDTRASAADPFHRLRPEATGHAVLLTVDMVLQQPVPAAGTDSPA